MRRKALSLFALAAFATAAVVAHARQEQQPAASPAGASGVEVVKFATRSA